MTLRLLWLGHPQVEQDGRPVRFEMRKALALLAYLSLERRRHARESLASLFWPDHDQTHALGNLRRTLSSLNKCLGPGWVESSREVLQLHPVTLRWLDTDAFQERLADARAHHHLSEDACTLCRGKLEEALALYRGDFLEGFTLPDCPDFDNWQLFYREGLRRDLAQALEMLAERLEAEGLLELAIDHARRWVSLDPLHEPAHRLLMGLYSRAGERRAAIRQYESCRETLLAELGQEPEAATTALYGQIAQAVPSSVPADPRSPPSAFTPLVESELSQPHPPPDPILRRRQTSELIRTKIRLPFIRTKVVPRPRLQEKIAQGLCGPLTMITAPAGFGKTILLASAIANCDWPVAWLSLDKHDNQPERFLDYLLAAIQEADHALGNEAAQLLASTRQAPAEAVLTTLINTLERAGRHVVLVLDDYQFVTSEAVHEAVTFLLERCPPTLHLVLASRSDPPLPLARLRARGQTVELRATDLSFTEPEAAQFLTEVMDLHLDAGSVTILAERTEGWIAGLQMAALAMQGRLQGTRSLQGRQDVRGFIERFSGTNRYILDYLLEEVLSTQPSEIQHFLLYTSILERLTAPLCDAVLANDQGSKREGNDRLAPLQSILGGHSSSVLEYLEKTNLFLVSLDDERIWYRYHHLFADLLRSQLQRSLGAEGVAELHIRAAEWHGQNGSILEAIHHASVAEDDERLERFIEQNYLELVSRGEQLWLRSWIGKLSKDLVYRRPWLCIYEAYSHSWFGELDEAERLIEAAEKRILSESSPSNTRAMQGLLAYVKSRVTAMRGDVQRAIELCLQARELIADSHVALQLDTRITLGYEYFMAGDYANAGRILQETIQMGMATRAVINTVAAACVMARLHAVQGQLRQSYERYQTAVQSIPEASGQHLGARALVDVGMADLLYEWNELDGALLHIEHGLEMLPYWGKADDFALARITGARIQLARGNESAAAETVDRASQVVRTRGVFTEARNAVEFAQVKLWLHQGDLQAANRWIASREERWHAEDPFRFENELAQIARVRVWIAQNRFDEALGLLPHLEERARSAGRMGRALEIWLLEALARWGTGDCERAIPALTECLTLAQGEGYVRLFLDEGRSLQKLLLQWLADCDTSGLPAVRDYATHLLSLSRGEAHMVTTARTGAMAGALVEPLSQRELEVLELLALGRTNQQIAEAFVIAIGTVKAHTSSIYRKLDVANRTEAVARARQLCILD